MPSTSGSSSSYFLQEMPYPPYCIRTLKSWGMIAISGGGGTAKTGVPNAVDLKWIYLNQSIDPKNHKCSAENINSFSQDDSVMRMVSLHKQNEYLILALNRQLKVIMLKPTEKVSDLEPIMSLLSPPTSPDLLSVPTTIRQRKNSSSSDVGNARRRSSHLFQRRGQITVEAVGNDTTNAISPSYLTSSTRRFSFSLPASPTPMLADNIYIVPIDEYEYVNALVVCPATQSKLFVGASDGSLQIYEILWPASSSSDRLIQLHLITSFSVHKKAIDDLAIDPFGNWLISVSRDLHVQIHQCSPPFDKHGELNLIQFGKNKKSTSIYRIRHVRFGFVPKSSNTKCYLYTSLIPQSVSDKIISSIVQWYENKQHKFIVRQRRGVSYDRILAMAVSNCGQYISAGDAIGYVRIYETNRLVLLYEQQSHTTFITDLAFILREENYLYETSVLSISADKNLYVHNVHYPQTNLISVSFLILMGLLLLFLLFSQIQITNH